MEQYKHQVVSVRVRGHQTVDGILLDAVEDWLVVKSIPVDYVVDGLLLINRKYILSVGASKNEGLVERVLRLKNVDFYEIPLVDTSSNKSTYNCLLSSSQLIQISLGDDSIIYIGQVIKVNDGSFRCRMVGVNGQWTNEESFKYSSVRMLGLRTDYVESITLLVDSEASHD